MSTEFEDQDKKQAEGFIDEYRDAYTDLATVESQRNDLIAEEFPDGPYGSASDVESLGKSTPWREDQRTPSAYSYENQALHQGIPRGYPGADDELDQASEE
ncbi:hypothetical protein [Paenibacillus aestuarii]|uniref:Uncharacterized protein n=1 Tax=Paenibacillus aestuarii TaxID=516965 RepID=A0ABW0K9Q3_9BACL|nr:hypothetical protein [Paenibacillus aestuarii]